MKLILIDFQNISCGAFGTLGLATLLRRNGQEAYVIGAGDILDLIKNGDKLQEVITAESPDAVGLSVMTPYADYIDVIGRLIRKSAGKVPIILGGYHATIFKKTIFSRHDFVDYIVMGDGEKSLPLLLDAIREKKSTEGIDGVLSRANKEGFNPLRKIPGPQTGDRNLRNGFCFGEGAPDLPAKLASPGVSTGAGSYGGPNENLLDDIPFPDEEVIHPGYYSRYLMDGHGCLPKPSRYVLYQRGCPYQCSFCKIEDDNGLRSKVRFYSAPRVVEHLGRITDKYGLKGIAFLDDNFTLNKEWAHKVCEGMIKNHINVKWMAQLRADLFDEDLLRLMRRAGCIATVITIESGNDRIRNMILGKNTTREQIRRAYEAAKGLGMLTQGSLMVGSPTEIYEECLDSIAFLKEIDPDYAGILLTTLLPGTPLHRKYEHLIKTARYRDYDITLQEEHYSRDDVKLAFHEIEPNILLETFRRIRRQYSYERRRRLSLRNFVLRERLYWMLRSYIPNIRGIFARMCLNAGGFYRRSASKISKLGYLE